MFFFVLFREVTVSQQSGLSERADPTSLKLLPKEEKHEKAALNTGSSLFHADMERI